MCWASLWPPHPQAGSSRSRSRAGGPEQAGQAHKAGHQVLRDQCAFTACWRASVRLCPVNWVPASGWNTQAVLPEFSGLLYPLGIDQLTCSHLQYRGNGGRICPAVPCRLGAVVTPRSLPCHRHHMTAIQCGRPTQASWLLAASPSLLLLLSEHLWDISGCIVTSSRVTQSLVLGCCSPMSSWTAVTDW